MFANHILIVYAGVPDKEFIAQLLAGDFSDLESEAPELTIPRTPQLDINEFEMVEDDKKKVAPEQPKAPVAEKEMREKAEETIPEPDEEIEVRKNNGLGKGVTINKDITYFEDNEEGEGDLKDEEEKEEKEDELSFDKRIGVLNGKEFAEVLIPEEEVEEEDEDGDDEQP